MKEFTLKRKEIKTIKITIDDKSFQIPLQGSLTFKESKALDGTSAGTYLFMQKYIPKEVLEGLKVEEYNQILSVWKEESEKNSGKTLGEL